MGVHMSDMLVHIWLVDEAVCMSLRKKRLVLEMLRMYVECSAVTFHQLQANA